MESNITYIIVGIILIALLVIVAIELIKMASKITGLEGYSDDQDLKNAHKYASWGASVAVLSVAGIIIFFIFIGYIFIASKAGTLLMLLFIIAALIATGVLAIIATIDLKKSKYFDSSNPDCKSAYDDGIIASVLAIGTLGLGLIGGTIYYISSQKKANAIKKQKAAEKKRTEAIENKIIENMLASKNNQPQAKEIIIETAGTPKTSIVVPPANATTVPPINVTNMPDSSVEAAKTTNNISPEQSSVVSI